MGQGRDVAGRKDLRMGEALQGGPHGQEARLIKGQARACQPSRGRGLRRP